MILKKIHLRVLIYMKKLIFILVVLVSLPAYAGWFTSDGDSFEDCMENRRGEIKNQSQMIVARQYCRSKHPLPSTPSYSYESPSFHQIMSAGSNNTKFWQYTANVTMTNSSISHHGKDYGSGIRSDDFSYYLEINATNRNEFPISGLIIGLNSPPVKGNCSVDDKSYKEIYTCAGNANAKQTGSFSCDIPRIEKLKYSYCLIGLTVYATESDFNRVILGK